MEKKTIETRTLNDAGAHRQRRHQDAMTPLLRLVPNPAARVGVG